MRRPFAHDATLVPATGGDERAPGAAVTVELCGGWDHPPPCPLAPHHTASRRVGSRLELHVLFVVEPEREAEVRERIEASLRRGRLTGPDGVTTTWQVEGCRPSVVRDDEAEHAERLATSP